MKWLKNFAHLAGGAFLTGFAAHFTGSNLKSAALAGLVGGLTAVFSLNTEKPQ